MSNLCEVYLMDLGVEVVVPSEVIYESQPECFKRGPLALRLQCMNLKANPEDPEVIDYFNSLVRDSAIKVRITHEVIIKA